MSVGWGWEPSLEVMCFSRVYIFSLHSRFRPDYSVCGGKNQPLSGWLDIKPWGLRSRWYLPIRVVRGNLFIRWEPGLAPLGCLSDPKILCSLLLPHRAVFQQESFLKFVVIMTSLFSDPAIRAKQSIFGMLMNVLRMLFLNSILLCNTMIQSLEWNRFQVEAWPLMSNSKRSKTYEDKQR